MRPRKERNRVYQESTVCFAILFLDHLNYSVVQFSLIPSTVVESFFVLLWSWKLLLPEEMDSQNNVKSSRMCLELCIFSSIVQHFTCEYSNSKAKTKGKQLRPKTLWPEQPKRFWTAFRPDLHCTRCFIKDPVYDLMKRMRAWLLGWAIFRFSRQVPVFTKAFP